MDKIQLGAAESQALLQGDSKSVAKLERCIYTFTYKHKREDVLGLSPTSQEVCLFMTPILHRVSLH